MSDTENLHTLLICEAHDQVSTAHLSTKKILYMLNTHCYWQDMSKYIS